MTFTLLFFFYFIIDQDEYGPNTGRYGERWTMQPGINLGIEVEILKEI